jgi:hypothetical protein
MYELAIDHLPYKIPLLTIGTLIISLAGSHLFGLIEVQLGNFHPRLLLILALYLLVIAAIIWIHRMMTFKYKVHLKSSKQIPCE